MNVRGFACLLIGLILTPVTAAAQKPPRPSHVIIIIEENRFYHEIIGSVNAPYINALARRGANFTNAHGITHPSAPNYYALFAGRTNSNGNDCPEAGFGFYDPNIGSQLLAARDTYAAYSESLPGPGFAGCEAGTYARKHAPWAHFKNLPPNLHQPFSGFPPPEKLPTVAFIVPNVDNDMHDGTIAQGDAWLAKHLDRYVKWAAANNTLIVLTWDEGFDAANSIPTIFYGPMIKPGNYEQAMNAYVILRTVEDMYGLKPLGHAAAVQPVLAAFR